jgi:hypothetical protein
VGIGGITSIFFVASHLTGKNPLSVGDVWAAIEANVCREEEELREMKVREVLQIQYTA